jgi:FSR family fosmidomycin resistance protein-like MFS transporter
MRTLLKNRPLLSYSLAHFSVDLCAGALPIIMVYLSQALSLSISQSAFVVGVYNMSSSLSQPLFGYLSDKAANHAFSKWQSALGLAWLATFQGLTGFASSYSMLLVLVALAGLGSAAFHPHGASGVNKSGGPRKSSAMAVFMMGGNSGYASGPLVAGLLLESLGVRGSIWISIIGLLLVPLVYFAGRSTGVSAPKAPSAQTNPNAKELALKFSRLAIAALMILMFLRAWTQAGVTSFMPIYFTKIAGLTVPQAAQIAFINLLALAMGGLLGGILADKFGGKRILIATLLINAPAVYLLFSTQGITTLFIAPLAGFVAGASWPPLIVMAQDIFPKNAGVASGISLGFAFAMGGIGQSITGWLADNGLGLQNSLLMLSVLPVLAAVCAVALPSRDVNQSAQRAPSPLGASR